MNNFVLSASSFLFLAFTACDVAFGPGVYDFHVPLSGKYYLWRTSSHTIFISPEVRGSRDPFIPAKVVEIDYDQKWVIAKQQHLRDRSPNDPDDNYQVPDPGKFSFWILRTDQPEVWGPLNELKFSEKMSSLGVTDTLKLRSVYVYACEVNEYYDCDDVE